MTSTPIHRVAGVVRVPPRRQPHRNRTDNGHARRQVTTTPVHQDNTQRRVTAHALAPSRRRQLTRSNDQPARRAVVVPRSPGAPRQKQRRVRHHSSLTHRHQQQAVAHRRQQQAVAHQRQQQAARRARITKVSETRAGSALRVMWPAHAILYFDRPAALRLLTAPGATVAVTLQAIIRTRGVGRRELALPYHTTTYARADRYGRVSIPLRDAYVPTHPTPATLTVVVRLAHDTVRRRTPVTLRR